MRLDLGRIGDLAASLRDDGQPLLAIADQHGISPETAQRHLALIDHAAPALLTALRKRQLTLAHARRIWPLPPADQKRWTRRTIQQGWSAHELAAKLRELSREQTQALVERFLSEPPTGVTTNGPRKRGPYKIQLTLRSRGQLQRVAKLLEGMLREE